MMIGIHLGDEDGEFVEGLTDDTNGVSDTVPFMSERDCKNADRNTCTGQRKRK